MIINKVVCGDAIIELRSFPKNSIDSIVTDPPAGISFMGKKWDDNKGSRDNWIKWLSEIMTEAKRVLKPGGHALVWALPRTSHWTGFALENAGFEVRDIVHHLFGSGFPKSMDISKAIDKQAGAERMIESIRWKRTANEKYGNGRGTNLQTLNTIPTTPEAKQWSGWGTALKPAVECWWLVRKPISEKTVAMNVVKWGTGGLNIDGCRVGTKEDMNPNDFDDSKRSAPKFSGKYNNGNIGQYLNRVGNVPDGRFPANLIHDGSDEVLEGFAKAGVSKSIRAPRGGTSPNPMSWGEERKDGEEIAGHNDSGTPARFFYCAKPSKAERDAGLSGNNHPTVKAQALMQYLIKLITPPGGIVLDPFAGSGSTLVAANKLGHPYIGIEIDPDYCKIAEKRLVADLNGNYSLDEFNTT